MNGKKESFEINIPTTNKPECDSKFGAGTSIIWWCKAWPHHCKEDSEKLIFGVKVGIAVVIVSLLILIEAPYKVFGSDIIWAILTAILVFEYTVGATFNRGFNRALGSLMAAILAMAVAHTAFSTGCIAEPIIIGLSIFFIAAGASFIKTWPSLVQYEYGFRVIILSYCLIILSGYRMGNPIRTMIDRLYSISIGGTISVLVNVFVYPIWAGEQLHKELVKSFHSVADSLEECVKKYFEDGFTTASIDESAYEPAYKRCQSTLNSGPQLEDLANSAKWEPPHGRFWQLMYPWSEYVKVGAVLRHCAYQVMALHSILHSEIQAPYNLRIAFRSEIENASNEAAELVRILGRDISSMKWSLTKSHLKRVHSSTERLQRSMQLHSYLLITATTSESPAHDNNSSKHPEKNSNLIIAQSIPSEGIMPPEQTEPYHDEMMRKKLRRLYSWPSREVDAYEEDSGSGTELLLPRMRALESTAALSVANFTSSLVEFVARVDHLIEAVDKLSKMAKFKPEAL